MRPVLGLVALAAAAFLARTLLAPPEYSRRPRLAAVVDGGKMEEFLETPEEKEAILKWVADGAPDNDWSSVAAIFDERCNTCHASDASFAMLPLDDFESAAASAKLAPLLLEKITGGTMGEYLESRRAQTILVDWIRAGAPESRWPDAKAVIDAHCLQCHNPEGVQGIVTLQTYPGVARLAKLPPELPRPIAAPVITLLASVGLLGVYGRRKSSSSS